MLGSLWFTHVHKLAHSTEVRLTYNNLTKMKTEILFGALFGFIRGTTPLEKPIGNLNFIDLSLRHNL